MALYILLASVEEVRLLLLTVFPSLPVVTVVVLKKRIPPFVAVDEPLMVQYFTILPEASLMNRMVEVPAVEDVLVLLMTRSFVLPTAFTLPSMVTLSGPFRSIKGVARSPLMLSPVTVG